MKHLLFFTVFILSLGSFADSNDLRPFAEYEPVKYLFMSVESDYQTQDLKPQILEKLPKEIVPILYWTFESDMMRFKKRIEKLNIPNIIYLKTQLSGKAFWARDSFPYPVLNQGKVELVDTPYNQYFEPDKIIANLFQLPRHRHTFDFEHGNFVANTKGDCFVVSDVLVRQMPDETFQKFYGCKRLVRLPFIVGIGHGDEVVKFISDDVILTNQESFVDQLKAMGYKVLLLPEAKITEKMESDGWMPQRSYVNSLMLNKKIFVPVFGTYPDVDEAALNVYRSLPGFEIIPILSAYVADIGGGALHCLTATYPDSPIFLKANP